MGNTDLWASSRTTNRRSNYMPIPTSKVRNAQIGSLSPYRMAILAVIVASCGATIRIRAETPLAANAKSSPAPARTAAQAPAPPLPQKAFTFKLGDSTVTIIEHSQAGPCKLTFFGPHGNEKTSVRAALEVIRHTGGRVLEIKNDDRYLTFTTGGKKFVIDPNRIFSEEGIKKTLILNNSAALSDAAVAAVGAFSKQVLDLLKSESGNPWVAVHNNYPGRLNLNNVLTGAQAKEIFPNRALPLNDFFLVTQKSEFDKLKGAGYNVVLQNNQAVKDDGSLSVYCGQKGLAYINVEAQHGRFAPQVRMIEAVVSLTGSGHLPAPVVAADAGALQPKKDGQATEN